LDDKNNEPYQIVCRESDGYIDVTNLCKAGGKEFKAWNKRKKTKEFIKALEIKLNNESQKSKNNSGIILTSLLIKFETGYGSNQGTWVHPKVAINIAQWISPEFDLQVSDWVHQLLVMGQVRLTDDVKDEDVIEVQINKQKHNRLVSEGNEKDAEIIAENIANKMKELEDKNTALIKENIRISKYLERKRRKQYDKKKVIYIIKHNKFKDQYKVGIANSLTSRVSVYNTGAPEDYDVIFHRYTMNNDLVEANIKRKFIDKLFTYNKEWYVLPEGIDDLIENIDNCIEFFER
jgi:hypothetical protein